MKHQIAHCREHALEQAMDPEWMNEWMNERMDEWIGTAWIRISLYTSYMKRRLTWDQVTYRGQSRCSMETET